MIPRIIHYCWFGGKDKPANVLKMIETWKNKLPEYEIKEWNESNFDTNYCNYSREAYLTGNYAHVSDVARLYALFHHGGIYLDTDVEVLKTFDPFLNFHSFCGIEHRWIATNAIGAEKGCLWIKIFLNFYKKRHFINMCGHTVRTANTKLLTQKIWQQIPPNKVPLVFDMDFFCAKNWSTGQYQITENTVCIHHYACSWKRQNKSILKKIALLINGLKIRFLKK